MRFFFNILFFVAIVFYSINAFSQSASNYSVSRSSGEVYNSISSSGSTVPSWRNSTSTDDNRSNAFDIGFDFWYLGVRYTQISVSTNGYLDFSSSTANGSGPNAYGYNNTTISDRNKTSALILAPFYDNLALSSLSNIKYELSGTSPNRVFTIEWVSADFSANTTPDLNFQVKLYETSGDIEFCYGTNTAGTATYSYSCGINNATISATPTAAELKTQQTANTATFSNTPSNSLSAIPESDSKITLSPPTPASPSGSLSFTNVASSSMDLNWTDWATNEMGYVIYMSEDGTTFSYISQTSAGATSYSASGLLPGVTYYWQVKAVTEGELSSALSGNQITTPPVTLTSNSSGNWNTPTTWTPNGLPGSTTNVTIADGHTITLDNTSSCYNLTVGQGTSGTLQLGNNTTVRTLTVTGNITINSGASLTVNAVSNATHNMVVSGDISNAGTFNLQPDADSKSNITFNKNGSQTVSGSGSTTTFNNITVNLGSSKSNVLEITSSAFSAATNFLTLTNGTFKLSTSASGSFTFTGSLFTISSSAGFWLNSSNLTLTAGGGIDVYGDLKLSSGTLNIGDAAGEDLSVIGGVVDISGGTLNAAGSLHDDSPSNMTLSISAGTVTLGTVESKGIAVFNIGTTSSSFTMSGGTIIIAKTATGSSSNWGVNIASGITSNITGGTLQIGNTSTPASTFYISSSCSFANFILNSTSATATLYANLTILNDLTITAGTLNASSYAVNVGRHWLNNGTFTYGTSTVNMNGTAGQTITKTGGETFYNLTVNKSSGTLTLVNDVNVNNALTMTSGNVDCGSNLMTIGVSTGSPGSLSYSSGIIIGKLKRWISATGTQYIFPIGTTSYSRKAAITFSNLTAGSLTTQFYATDPGSTGLPLSESGFSISNQFTDGYWDLTAANSLASTNYSVELTGEGFTSYTISSSTRVIKRTSGGSWTLDGTHVDAASNTAKRSALNGLSAQFGFGKPGCSTYTAVSISGTDSVCTNTTGVSYSVTNNPANTYTWTATLGTIASGQGTSSITVNWGSTGGDGNLQVVERNSCGDDNTAVSLPVFVHPLPISSISGSTNVAQNETGVAYSVTDVSGYSYNWSVSGGTIASGQGTYNIAVNWGTTGMGNVYVTVTQSCGGTTNKSLAVTIRGPIVSNQSGNWNTTTTWVGGVVPTSNDYVEIASGHTVTMDGNQGNCYKLTLNGTATWTSSYTTTVGAGGIVISSTGDITGAVAGILATTGGLTINKTLTSNTVSIVLQTASGQTISGTGSVAKLAINTTATNNGNITVRSQISGASTLSQGTNSTLNLNCSSITISGLDASATGNTVSYGASASQTIKTGTYNNLSLSGTGTKTLGGAVTVNGSVSINTVAVDVSASNYGLNVKGNFSNTNGSFAPRYGTITFSGTTSYDSNTSLNFYNISQTGSVTVVSTTGFTLSGNWAMNGAYVDNTGTVTFNGTTNLSGTITPSFNNVTISGIVNAPSEATMYVTGNWENNGTFNHNNSTIVFDGETVLSGTSETTLNNVVIDGSLSGVSSGNFNVSGNFTNNGTFNGNSGTVTFNGSSAVLSGTSDVTQFNNAVINNGCSFSANPENNITCTGTLTVNGTLTLNSDASSTATLIENGISGTGSIISERYLSSAQAWYTSVPVSNGQGSLYGLDANNKMFYWDEPTGTWVAVSSGDNLSVMKGYPFKSTSNKTINYTGTFNSGSQNINLTRTTSAAKPGWNLIGNPYPSAIDWDAAGWTKTNIYNNTFWIRSNGQFLTYNGNTGIGVPDGTTSKIPAHQAFWVMVDYAYTSGSLALNNSVRVHDSQNTLKSLKSTGLDVLRVNITKNDFTDQAAICFATAASTGNDLYDSEKSMGVDNNIPQIFSLASTSKNLAINTFPTVTSSTEIKIGYKAWFAGEHTISITDFSKIDGAINVYLKDLTTGTVQDMRANNSYTFNTNATTNTTRFKLIFEKQILPIELLSFTGECVDGKVSLIWKTATEVNNDYFTVLRSDNGYSFSEIGKISGSGNSSVENNYSFIDDNPFIGINYYKLKQTDFNGKESVTKAILVNNISEATADGLIKCFSDNESLYIFGGINIDESTIINIYDVTGKMIMADNKLDEVGSINISKLTSGIYIVAISNNEGVLYSQKFIKN